MKARMRTAVVIVAIALGLFAAVGSGETEKATKVGSNGSSSSGGGGASAGAAPETFDVGDQVKLGDWVVVVNAVSDPLTSTNEFDKPEAGKRFVGLDVSVTNQGTEPETVSSLMCFDLVDDTGQSYTTTMVMGAPQPPDGEADPGQPVRGTLAYAVPEAVPAAKLSLKFKCDLFSAGSATVKLG